MKLDQWNVLGWAFVIFLILIMAAVFLYFIGVVHLNLPPQSPCNYGTFDNGTIRYTGAICTGHS